MAKSRAKAVKTREENRRLMEYMGKAVKEENGAKRNGPE